MARTEHNTPLVFNKGIYNAIAQQHAPAEAAVSSVGFRTTVRGIETIYGRDLWGNDTDVDGRIPEQWIFNINPQTNTPSREEDFLHVRRNDTKLQFILDGTWTNISDGSTTDLLGSSDWVYANIHQSLSGVFVYIMTPDKIYRMDPYSPDGDVVDIYDEAKNYRGDFLIDRSRAILWNRDADKTGLYFSHIDFQNNYTAVSAEACGTGNISRTLTALASNPERICFALVVTTPDGAFTDNRKGGFTDFNGDTVDSENYNANGYRGSINYSTGELVLEKQSTPFGSCTVDYQWQDVTDKGVMDFATLSTPRINGEYSLERQDEDASPILNVIPYQGVYFSFRERGIYGALVPKDDSSGIINRLINRTAVIPNKYCVVATTAGIIYLDTQDSNNVVLTTLRTSIEVENVDDLAQVTIEKIAPQFDWSQYNYDYARMIVFGGRIYIACRTKQQELNNGRNNIVIVYDVELGSVDVDIMPVESWVLRGSDLYVGDTISPNVFKAYSTFDDDEQEIERDWKGVADDMETKGIKRIRRGLISGRITSGVELNIYMAFDKNDSWSLIKTIKGSDYDTLTDGGIGSDVVGDTDIGGGSIINQSVGSYYEVDLAQISTPRFTYRALRFVVTGYGYCSVEEYTDTDVRFRDYRLQS